MNQTEHCNGHCIACEYFDVDMFCRPVCKLQEKEKEEGHEQVNK